MAAPVRTVAIRILPSCDTLRGMADEAHKSAETRPGGMGGVIFDAQKGMQEKAIVEAQERVTAIESLPVRVRQEIALAHEWVAPSKMGRPTEYDNETMPPKVYKLLSNRDVIFTQKMIATRLGVSVTTLKVWKGIHQDLAAAIAQGLSEQEGWLASQMATGMKYSASMYAVLKNLHDWSERVENTHTMDLTEAIRKQAGAGKRVQWDKAQADPLRPATPPPSLTPAAQTSTPAHTQAPAPTPDNTPQQPTQ